jgi:hypothetical protein
VSWRQRGAVLALIAAAALSGLALVAFASTACPFDLPERPCPDYARNRVVVVALAALSAGLAVAPFAFLADFVAKRRIVYRGAGGRAARRGAPAAAAATVLAGLRLGEVMSVPVVIFVVILAFLVDRVMAARRG